jgi:hypothetical protein
MSFLQKQETISRRAMFLWFSLLFLFPAFSLFSDGITEVYDMFQTLLG